MCLQIGSILAGQLVVWLPLQAIQHNLRGIKAILGEPSEVHVATVPGGESLTDWAETFRITQASALICLPRHVLQLVSSEFR